MLLRVIPRPESLNPKQNSEEQQYLPVFEFLLLKPRPLTPGQHPKGFRVKGFRGLGFTGLGLRGLGQKGVWTRKL